MTGQELVEQELARQLQASLDQIRTGASVMKLTEEQADAQALRLRTAGLPYIWIAKVMGVYHGEWFSESRWRTRCRAAGAPAKHHPNGTLRVPPQMRRATS